MEENCERTSALLALGHRSSLVDALDFGLFARKEGMLVRCAYVRLALHLHVVRMCGVQWRESCSAVRDVVGWRGTPKFRYQ